MAPAPDGRLSAIVKDGARGKAPLCGFPGEERLFARAEQQPIAERRAISSR